MTPARATLDAVRAMPGVASRRGRMPGRNKNFLEPFTAPRISRSKSDSGPRESSTSSSDIGFDGTRGLLRSSPKTSSPVCSGGRAGGCGTYSGVPTSIGCGAGGGVSGSGRGSGVGGVGGFGGGGGGFGGVGGFGGGAVGGFGRIDGGT